MKFRIAGILAFLAVVPFFLFGQQKQEKDNDSGDRFVRLMSAQSVRMQEIDGKTYRRAEGPARFLHNDTWLICDTALWDVDGQIIHAIGNVSIEQERTELTGDSLVYFVESNLAQFRGSLVQLRDKDQNTLRTRNLDYNTKDSVAVFRFGGAMRDKDGQLIESIDGSYDSKIKLFTFEHDVNMYTDSVFIKTSYLKYDSGTSVATFPNYVEMWKDDKMFSGSSGWYDRAGELFFFKGDVHMLSSVQEGWCDTVYFYRGVNNLDMKGNVQLVDTSRAVTSMAGRICYDDSLARVRLYYDPVVLMETQSKDSKDNTIVDTLYFRGDTLSYWTVKRCDVDTLEVETANARLKEIEDDPVLNIRQKAAEEAAKRRQEAIDNDPNAPPELKSKNPDGTPKTPKGDADATPDAAPADAPAPAPAPAPAETAPAPENPGIDARADSVSRADSLSSGSVSAADSAGVSAAVSADSVSVDALADTLDSGVALPPVDSLKMRLDSLARADSLMRADSLHRLDSLAHRDTTKIGFMWASGNVKMFRKDMQAVCDSLRYSDLDSLARMFKNPIVWNERGQHQYSSDSLYLSVHGGRADKANLLSNAFIEVDEDGRFHDQIRSAEMTAFFDPDNRLKRYDAMGGVTALFFMKEDDRISSANKSEATIMSVDFVKGEIDQITYFESPKSDVYPVAQIKKADMALKGSVWQPELRPASPADLTSRVPNVSERKHYESRPRAEFRQTEIYFKGYMGSVYREIARADSLKKVARSKPSEPILSTEDSLSLAASLAKADSLLRADSLHVADSLFRMDSLLKADSLLRTDSLLRADSLKRAAAVADSLSALDTLSPQQRLALEKAAAKAKKKAEAQAKKEARQKAKEEHWAELDARDAARVAARQAKKKARQEHHEAVLEKKMMEQKAKEDALLERYRKRYEKQREKKMQSDARKNPGEVRTTRTEQQDS